MSISQRNSIWEISKGGCIPYSLGSNNLFLSIGTSSYILKGCIFFPVFILLWVLFSKRFRKLLISLKKKLRKLYGYCEVNIFSCHHSYQTWLFIRRFWWAAIKYEMIITGIGSIWEGKTCLANSSLTLVFLFFLLYLSSNLLILIFCRRESVGFWIVILNLERWNNN